MTDFEDIKDKKKPLDEVAEDKKSASDIGAELLKIRQQKKTERSVPEVRLMEKIKHEQEAIEKLNVDLGAAKGEKDFYEVLGETYIRSNKIQAYKDKMEELERGRVHGAEKSFQQSIRTAMSPTNTASEIAAATRQSSTLGIAVSTAEKMTTSQLEESISKSRVELALKSEAIRDTSAHVEGNEPQLRIQMQERHALVQKIAQEQAALAAQKKMGIDTASQYYRAAEITEKAKKEQEVGQIKQEVEEGKFGSKKQAEEQLEAITKRLIATFEQFDVAVKSGSKETGELAKKFDETQKEWDRQKAAVKEMGGGGVSGIQVAGGIIGGIGTIAQGVGQAYRHMAITSEAVQAQNRIGFAQMANQRFTDAYGATQGDMSALRRVMANQYSEQVRRGLLMSGREDTAKLIETGATGAKAVGTAVDTMAGPEGAWAGFKGFMGGGQVGAAAAMLTTGVAKATPDAVNFVGNVTDYSKANTQAQEFLRSAQQMRQLQDAVSQISDFSSQTAADYNKNITRVTRGLGTGKIGADYYDKVTLQGTGKLGSNVGVEYLPANAESAVLEQVAAIEKGTGDGKTPMSDKLRENIDKYTPTLQKALPVGENPLGPIKTEIIKGGGDRQNLQTLLTDPKIVNQLANVGLGLDELPSLVGAGRTALGKEFTRDRGRGGINDLTRAGQLSQIGYLDSPEQMFQARSMLTGVGGKQEDLEEILKNAVANGMDSSKNIMQMVEATTSLSARSAAMGVSTASGAAAMLGKGVDQLRSQGVPENMAVTAAQTAAQFMSESAASTDLTLANVVEAARVQKAFPGAPIWEQEALRLARPEQVAQLQIAYKKKAKGGKEGAEGAEEVTRLQKKMGIQKNTITDIEGVNRLAEITTEQTTTDLIGFGVDRRLEKSVQELQRTGRKPTEEEETYMNARGISRKISGTAAAASVQQGVEASKKGLAAAPGGGMEGQAAAAAMGQAKVFADGVDNINKAVGGLSALGETMKKVAEKLDPGEFSKATQGAAKDFLVPVNAFGSSVTKFDNAVSKLVDAVISIAKDTAKDMGKTDSSKTSVNLPGQVNRYQDRQTIPGGKE